MINLISSMLTNLGILKKINDVISGVDEHIGNKNNPHQVTAEQLGLAAAYTYQGDVDNFASLPTHGVQKGWVYNVKTEFILNNEKYPAGTDVAWDGSKWNTLGGSLKGYIRKVNNIAPDSDSNVNIKSLILTTIQTATDLNNIKVEGRYQCDTDSVAATLLNSPLNTAFYLDVYVNSSTQVKQVITSSNATPQVYIRTLVNNTWGSWRTVQFTTTVYNMTEIKNTTNTPIKLTGSFSHKYHEIAGGNIDLVSNIDVYWVTPTTSDIGVTINLSALTRQSGYSRFITLYVDGSKCPDLRTITYTNKPSGFTLMNEPEKMMGGMVNVIGIEIVGSGNIYTITNNGGNGSNVAIATEEEALEGIDNTKMMTSLRVKESIKVNAPVKSVNGVVAGADGDVKIHTSNNALDAYPIGAIYISTIATSPATLFGGEWETLPAGRVLLAQGTSYPAGSTGGEASVNLTTAQMPAHNHDASTDNAGAHEHGWYTGRYGSSQYSAADDAGGAGTEAHFHKTTGAGSHSHTVIVSNTGGGQAHNNMQPYLSVYMWKRTA